MEPPEYLQFNQDGCAEVPGNSVRGRKLSSVVPDTAVHRDFGALWIMTSVSSVHTVSSRDRPVRVQF